jgi:hypothetical protein
MIHDNSSAAYATIQDMTLTHQLALLKIKGFVSNPYTRPCKVTGRKSMVWVEL